MQQPQKLQLVLGVSGASGSLYAYHFIRALTQLVPGKSALIVSPAALRVYRQEYASNVSNTQDYLKEILTGISEDSCQHSFHIEDHHDIGARSASGSSPSDGMVIIPCSMKSMADIAHGQSGNLIERAADVCLKERRRLVVVPRETPYSIIHLENMLKLSRAGVIVLPASPGFYQKPKSIDDIGRFIAGRVLSLFHVDHQLFAQWQG